MIKKHFDLIFLDYELRDPYHPFDEYNREITRIAKFLWKILGKFPTAKSLRIKILGDKRTKKCLRGV
jgi:hypothetical protein